MKDCYDRDFLESGLINILDTGRGSTMRFKNFYEQ